MSSSLCLRVLTMASLLCLPTTEAVSQPPSSSPRARVPCAGLDCFTRLVWGDDFSCTGGQPSATPNVSCSSRFNGKTTDPRWTVVDLGEVRSLLNKGSEIYRADHVAIVTDDGMRQVLRITSDYRDGAYYSGAVRTESRLLGSSDGPGLGWGRLDVRADLRSRGDGFAHWPAVWLAHPVLDLVYRYPDYRPFEIDLAERFQAGYQDFGYFFCPDGYFGCPRAEVVPLRPPPPGLYPVPTGFHTYSLTRAPAGSFGSDEARACVYFDGAPLTCIVQGQRFPVGQYLTPPTQLIDNATGGPALLQVILNAAIGGTPNGFASDCHTTSPCPEHQVCRDAFCQPDPEEIQTSWMDIDSVKIYQPPRCPSGCEDMSPEGYRGYICDCSEE